MPRPELSNQLNNLIRPGKRFALICAPAGYGKTTLVSHWTQHIIPAEAAERIAWYSLDESDNDPFQFIYYITASIQKQYEHYGKHSRELIQSSQPFSPQTAVRMVTQDLLEIPHPLILVLDDYHVIHNLSIHEGLCGLLEYLPPQVHFVFIARSDPPFPVHRYRARAQMLEIRQGDLRFTPDQVTDFIQNHTGKQLTPSQVDLLEQRTEGWPAGLQMAALNLQHSENTKQFIEGLTNNQHFILEYLSEEVFKHQDGYIQRFLLTTSLLDRFNVPLCEEVSAACQTGNQTSSEPSCSELLAQITRLNLFLVPLDSERTWFRYHHLFSDFLRTKTKHSSKEFGIDPHKIHASAAAWYEREGWHHLGIQHFILAGDFDQAGSLVEKQAVQLFARGMLSQMISWIRLFPHEFIDRSGWLCLYLAWALCFAGQNKEAHTWLNKAEDLSAKVQTDREKIALAYEIKAVRSMLAITSGNIREAFELTTTIEPPPDTDRMFAYSVILWSSGYGLRMAGKIDSASGLFKQVLDIGLQTGNAWTILSGCVDYGNTLKLQGRLFEAEQIFRQGLERVLDTRQGQGFIGRLESFLASVLYEKDNLEEAYQLARSGIEHNHDWENPNHLVYGYWVLARIYYGSGNIAKADETLRAAENLMLTCPVVSPLRTGVEGSRIRLWLRDGEISKAISWMEEHPNNDPAFSEAWFQYHLCSARVKLAGGDKAEAYTLASRIVDAATSTGFVCLLIEASILCSLSAPDPSQVGYHLLAALKAGLPAGFQRVFLDEGEGAAELVRTLLDHPQDWNAANHLMASIRSLYAKFEAIIPRPTKPALSGSLTRREIEILGYIAAGCTNHQIGEKLFISTGTVKAHTAAIFRKLDAANRAEAVKRGHDLDLI